MASIDLDLNKIQRAGPAIGTNSEVGDRGKNPDELDPRQEADRYGARTPYKNQSSLNTGAKGQGNVQLNTRAAIANESLSCGTDRRSNYTQTQVTETPGGHVIEYNDTPGSERILLRHKSGSGIEMRPDGSILISATNIVYDIKGNMNTVITGNQTTQVDGSVINKVGGDITNKSGGTHLIDVGGTLVETVQGSKYSTIAGSVRSRVTGQTSMKALGEVSYMALGGLTESIKGDRVSRIEGSASLYTSGNMVITSATRAMISSAEVAITAPKLEVVGNTGTIGGTNMIAYAYNAYIGKTMKSETVTTNVVYGDLAGTAELAKLADVTNSQNYPDPDTDPGSPGNTGSVSGYTVDATQVDEKATAAATAANLAVRQAGEKNGIRIVQVDPGNYIKATLDKTETYGYGTGAQ